MIFVQEVSYTIQQRSALERFWDKLGYKMYSGTHQNYVSHGLAKGVATFVLHFLKSSFIHLQGHSQGALLAVEVENILFMNSYSTPDRSGEAQQEQAAIIEETMVASSWHGPVIVGGDFNEHWEFSWISTVGSMLHLSFIPPMTSSTRWEGNKILDFFVVSQDLQAESDTLEDKISDHKVVRIRFKACFTKECEMKFDSSKHFVRPKWVPSEKWQQIFDTAIEMGIQSQWKQVAWEINHQKKWIFPLKHPDHTMPEDQTCQSDRCYWDPGTWGDLSASLSDDMEQNMVDFAWELYSRKMVWALQTAMYLALLSLPEGYDDFDEIGRVEALINGVIIRGTNSLVQKKFFKNNSPEKEQMRKLRKRLGRCFELKTKLLKGKGDDDTMHLSQIVFGGIPNLEVVEKEIRRISRMIDSMETSQKNKNLANWRHRLQHVPAAKATWIKAEKVSKNIQIKTDKGFTSTKHECAQELRAHWFKLLDQCKSTAEEKEEVIKEMREFFHCRVDKSFDFPRPELSVFRKALKEVSGCPGIDRWSSEECGLIAGNHSASAMAWREMELWETLSLAPSSLQNNLLVYIPKPGKIEENGQASCKDMRPISILSIFWRAWSATWVKNDNFSRFISVHLPFGLTFAAKGSVGTECLATIIDHEYSRLGFGASLDFTSCFDLVNLCTLREALLDALPLGLKGWLKLLIGSWERLQRWISISGHVLAHPFRSSVGIPQGDAASPIVLALFLWEGYSLAQQALDLAGGTYFMAVYMDDRTIVAERPDMVELAIQTWARFADRRKLLENELKIQKAAMHEPRPEGYRKTMEVLGATIGYEDPLGLINDEKQQQRVTKARELIGRIALLPEARWRKLEDIAQLVRGVYCYGWISTQPTEDFQKNLTEIFLKAIGRLPYGVPTLKRMLLFVHLDICEVTLVRQVRLLARRQQALQKLGIAVVPCTLDHMVHRGLAELGWIMNGDGDSWSLNGFSFALWQCCNFTDWGLIGHWIRDSIRRKHYANLFHLKRHELVGQRIPQYNADRLCLVRKWMKGDTIATLLATGAISSAAARFNGQPGAQVLCPKCSETKCHWHHYWRCWLDLEPPTDVLFRRFLWPRSTHDLEICKAFRDWAEALIECHVNASKKLASN